MISTGRFRQGGIVSKRPKLALEHAYKKISATLLKKNPPGI